MFKDMSRREFLRTTVATGVILSTKDISSVFAQELKPIQLLPPQLDGGRPLMQVLRARKSIRSYSDEKLSLQALSNLLWAAFGINRPESGRRTAPTGGNLQNIEIYVATAEGVYVYDAKAQVLNPILAEDIRSLTGRQYAPPGWPPDRIPSLDEAPVNLIYVYDGAKKARMTDEDNLRLAFNHTGYISQNVYLYCASEGLATIVRLWFDKPAVEEKMGLRPEQYATLVQSVAYPKKTS